MTDPSKNNLAVSPLSRIRIGLLSALIAGAKVGFLESILVVATGSELTEWGVFTWAVIAYGLLALLIGLGYGTLGAVVSAVRKRRARLDRIYSFYLALTFTSMLLIIGRFRIIRDIYHEIPPGPSLDIKLLLGGIALFLFLHFLVLRFTLRVGPWKGLVRTGGSLIRFALIVVIAIVVSVVGGPSREEPEGKLTGGTAGGPNVLLIIIDTLRADHLPIYGYGSIETPAFDRLAADGIVYRKAFSQASWTKPSIASILTGLYPSTHQAIHKGSLLPDDVPTLAEALLEAGYFTVGLPNNENIFPIRNFQQGFQVYEALEPDFFFYATESAFHLTLYNQLRLVRERFLSQKKRVEHYYQDAAAVNRHAMPWVDRSKGGSFFLFLHYMEPHDPYFRHPYDGTGYARVNNPNPSPDLARTYRETYDGEIVYLDQHLGELFRYLEEEGLYRDLLIVLTSDHGEEFYEHEGWWHGTTLYEEQINVPLIIKLPGNAHAGTSTDGLVRSIDIAPSILSIAGASIPATVQGQSILPDSTGTVGAEAVYVFSEEDLEGNVLQSVRGVGWKLILANEGNPRGLEPEELYDLTSDPGESMNLSAGQPDIVTSLRERAAETRSLALGMAVQAQEKEMSDVERERLKALGYVQ